MRHAVAHLVRGYTVRMSPGWRRFPGWAVLLLAGCTTADGSAPFGVAQTQGSSSVDVGGDAEGESATTGDVEPPECLDDGDCDGVSCRDGQCQSCDDRPTICTAEEVCVRDQCRRPETLEACEGLGYSVCGNGILQAGEACDGTPGCDACMSSTAGLEPFGEALNAERIAIAPDGTVAAVVDGGDEADRLVLADADGTPRSTTLVTLRVWEVRWGADAVYVLGDDVAQARVLAVGPGGQVQWSRDVPFRGEYTSVVHGDMLVLGGAVDQASSNTTRGLVVGLDRDGNVMFEHKQGDMRVVQALAVMDEALVIAGTHTSYLRSVVRRLDSDGEALWTDAAETDLDRDRVALFGDGTGGTWFFSDVGTAVHFDADGERLDEIPCFGFVWGSLTAVVRGPSSELVTVFSARLQGAEANHSWIVRGMPDTAQSAWVDLEGSIRAVAWTPEGHLVASVLDDARLHEVTF